MKIGGKEGKKGGTKPKEQVEEVKREGKGRERTLDVPVCCGLSLRFMSPKISRSGTQRRIDRVFQVPL